MRYILIILFVITASCLSAQKDLAFNDFSALNESTIVPETYSQKLYILRKNGKTVKISYYYIHKIEESSEWKELLESFQDDLGKVKENLPAYDLFEINYRVNEQLTIEEIKDKKTFTLSDANGNTPITTNYATLWGKEVVIQLELEVYDDLLDTLLASEMAEAVSKIKSKRTFDFSFTNDKLYNSSTGMLIKDPAWKGEIEYLFGANMGFLGRSPAANFHATLGLSLNLKTHVYGRAESILATTSEGEMLTVPGVGLGFKSKFKRNNSNKTFQLGFEAIYQPPGFSSTGEIGFRWVAFLGWDNQQQFRFSFPAGTDTEVDVLGLDFLAPPTFTMVTRF